MWPFGKRRDAQKLPVPHHDQGNDVSIEELKKENENLKKALLVIQQNLIASVDFSKSALTHAETTRTEAASSISGISNVISGLETLSGISQTSSQTAANLTEKAKKISGIIKLINEIAMQTNILSLNAAVEAARAGEHGVGFSVVADEVKKLADNTRDAVDEISVIVEQVVGEIDNINHQSGEITTNVDQTSALIRQLEAVIQSSSRNADLITTELERIDSHEFLTLAKLDHIIWKINTYLSIIHKKPVFEFVDHHNCRLGKWYEQGEGKSHFSHTYSYGDLVDPHCSVHDATRIIFELLAEDPIDWNAISEATSNMEHASDQVFAILDRMLDEKDTAIHTQARLES